MKCTLITAPVIQLASIALREACFHFPCTENGRSRGSTAETPSLELIIRCWVVSRWKELSVEENLSINGSNRRLFRKELEGFRLCLWFVKCLLCILNGKAK